MSSKKKVIAIILARGNSKSIKNKNLRLINKKPLLFWSFKLCKLSKCIHEVWLSSDSEKILNYGKKNNINIIKRPKKLATSKSSSESAWLHAIKFLEKKKKNFDIVLGIQPTSPIRSKNDFDNAIKKFILNKYDSLFSSVEIRDYFIWKSEKKKLISNYNYINRKPRQFIKKQYLENGSFFIFDKENFKKYNCRLFKSIGTYTQKIHESFQLDEHHDIPLIESIMRNKKLFKL
jgi:CMP-N,N'-diacetyllegionaminic acid synthase